ncbi:HNH endonuclease family protein [Georgenia muralis]
MAPTRDAEAVETGPADPNASVPFAVPASPTESAPTAAGGGDGRPSALDAVALLLVSGRAPMTGYDRDLFAYREVDHDRNGCDVRNDVLRRDLSEFEIRASSNGCTVERGILTDPYTGADVDFIRGAGSSSDVQIDHVVALGNAWAMGAQQWDEPTRHRFGNDPLNLLAVDGEINQEKGAGDLATWLPPNVAFRCEYTARQVTVKLEYGLRVTVAERDAMERVLRSCPAEPLLASEDAATP